MARLDGRVAIVTGAGRGIGRSVARLLASQGASVVVNDLGSAVDGSGHDSGPAHDVVAEIAEAGGKAVANGADISVFAAAENLVQTAIEEFGRLDILVNVAGILRDRMVFNMTEQEWDDVIRVHMKGTFNTTRFASAHWRSLRDETAQNRIINFTSVSGLHGAPGQPNYAAAKMGIVGLTWSSARALGKYGVTVNAISPGAATRMTDSVPTDRRRTALKLPRHNQEHILDVQYAQDIVKVAFVDRVAAVPFLLDRLDHLGQGGVDRDRVNLGARHHYLPGRDVAQVKHAPQDGLFLFLQHACLAARSHQHFKLFHGVYACLFHIRAQADQPEHGVAQDVD